MSARAGLALALLVLATGAAQPPSCPTVYHLGGDRPPSETYNILFLGAGFEESELPAFREVVQELASKVVERESFAPYRGWINVYRMDLVSKKKVDLDRCSDRCNTMTPLAAGIADQRAPETDGSFALGTPLYPEEDSDPTPKVDLVARRCWDGSKRSPGNCNLIWLDADDRAEILDLQFCAPNVKAVVVVANLQELVGGALEDALSTGVGLTVIGSSPASGDEGALAGPWAVALLEHELGHLFGLYDEYIGVTGSPQAVFHADRNVWRPLPKTPAGTRAMELPADVMSDYYTCQTWELDPATIKLEPPIPWQSTLDQVCPKAGLANCNGSSGPGDGFCVWSPSEREVCESTTIPGLWEGAYYRVGCFHRERYTCLMKEASPEMTPCEACRGQIRRAFCSSAPQAAACVSQ